MKQMKFIMIEKEQIQHLIVDFQNLTNPWRPVNHMMAVNLRLINRAEGSRLMLLLGPGKSRISQKSH